MVQRLKCPQCATLVTARPDEAPVCPNCGFRGEGPEAPAALSALPSSSPSVPPAQPVPVLDEARPISQGTAITALIVNLILPGVGSLIVHRKAEGIWQLVMVGASILLWIVLIGPVILLAAWVWALVVSLQTVSGVARTGLPA